MTYDETAALLEDWQGSNVLVFVNHDEFTGRLNGPQEGDVAVVIERDRFQSAHAERVNPIGLIVELDDGTRVTVVRRVGPPDS
jgi:hypothetical protein